MNTKNTEIKEFSIQGMSCTGCAGRIERGLSATTGVNRAVVNFATHTAIVESGLSAKDIEKRVDDLGYKAELIQPDLPIEEKQRQEQKQARNRLYLALALGLPVIVFGMSHQLAGLTWVRAIEALLTFGLLVGPGAEFFVKAVKLLKQRTANMDTLVSLGAGISFAWSCIQALSGSELVYFETAAAIVVFVLVGKYIEHRMAWRATSSLGELLRLQPAVAIRVSNTDPSQMETVDLRFVRVGDQLITRVGERFAADGAIVDGKTEVDESLLTGESLPVLKSVGDSVVAGSLNKVGAVTYTVQAVGERSRLGEIVAFVERTQLTKAPIQRLADRVSAIFVPVILVLSALTFLAWKVLLKNELSLSLNAAISVLVVACPCALGLATPIAVMIATGRAARGGILFRDLAALESLQTVQTVVFDKTGTLTEGKLSVCEEKWFDSSAESEANRQALSGLVYQLEQRSQHPIAAALVDFLGPQQKRISSELKLSNFKEVAGEGLFAVWHSPQGERSVRIGRPSQTEIEKLPKIAGQSWVVCSVDQELKMAWSLQDTIRTQAAHVVSELRKMNVSVVLASGDHVDAVKPVGEALGIEYHAEQNPRMKAELIDRLQAKGQIVAMLGDGVNDAPALAAAKVGIAMGGGSDAAQQTASLTLKDTSLMGVLSALQLSRVTFRNIRQNLGWAFGYNFALIPLAMMGRLTPMWAAAAMAFSSLFVVLNALRLARFEVLKES